MNESIKKVVKFGGSSLASAEQFRKSAAIVLAEESRRFVVPSAPGKRFPEDEKVTDMLLDCHRLASEGRDFSARLAAVRERYELIRTGLGLAVSLDEAFAVIEENLHKGCSRDYAASRGEYLNGILLAFYLGYAFVDAAEVVFFDEDGIFDGEKTNRIMAERLSQLESAVIPGFYGVMPDGRIRTFSRGGSDITGALAAAALDAEVKTFSRGGSDVTGAIVARAVMADLYENWTDVSGFLMADPRIVRNPQPIKLITYRELRELSYMGATVLHEDSIFPVKLAGIPINIRNTNRPSDPGTMIVPAADSYGESAIARATEPDHIEIEKGLSLIAVVGRGMIKTPGTASRVFAAVARAGINVRMIDQGSSELNIILAVEEKDFERAIDTIYREFIHA